MDSTGSLKTGAKVSYGLGAVGKDMVYMLSASYVLYYFQDLLGVSAAAMSVILLAARIFDAFNDPIMGIIVAKTKTRMGKFRPWLLIGTLTDAVILYMMFAAPPALNGSGLIAYAAVTYILWGVTYTMMDIPYWSMIPAFTKTGKEREGLTTLARSCAGIGSSIIVIVTVKSVATLGNLFNPNGIAREQELTGFKWFTLIVAVLFVIFEVICVFCIKEESSVDMKAAKVKDMFKALVQNDQAMTVVVSIVLINCSIYLTSNLVIYFFKYDFGGSDWNAAYTLFNMFGGGIQILSMIVLYTLLRKKFSSLQIFYISLGFAIAGYAALLSLMFTSMKNVYILFIPAFFIFAANGLLSILTTVFLANTVDYGELKNGRRDESVIFSMQTFVVKLASGIAIFIAGMCLELFKLNTEETANAAAGIDLSQFVSASSKIGLRMTMAVVPILGLLVAFFWFKNRFILTDDKLEKINVELANIKAAELI